MTVNEVLQTTMKYLDQCNEGDTAVVREIDGGKGARQKLFDLGIVPGVTITIVQGSRGRPYILQAGGTKVMIGWGMAEKIQVE